MKYTTNIIILLIILLINSCTNAVDPNAMELSSYFPLSQGSTWSYKSVSNYIPDRKIEVTGDTLVKEFTYNTVRIDTVNVSTPGFAYYRISNNDLIEGMTTDSGFVDRVILKTNVAVGETWSNTFFEKGRIVTHIYKFVSSTDSIRLTDYSDPKRLRTILHHGLIVVSRAYKGIVPDRHYYYERGIGLIRTSFGSSVSPSGVSNLDLESSHVK